MRRPHRKTEFACRYDFFVPRVLASRLDGLDMALRSERNRHQTDWRG